MLGPNRFEKRTKGRWGGALGPEPELLEIGQSLRAALHAASLRAYDQESREAKEIWAIIKAWDREIGAL